MAAGVFASFTPLFGLHFLFAALFARLARGNIMASLFGTFFGNPLTFPLIAWSSLELGHLILGGTVGAEAHGSLWDAFAGAWTDLWFNLRAVFTAAHMRWSGLAALLVGRVRALRRGRRPAGARLRARGLRAHGADRGGPTRSGARGWPRARWPGCATRRAATGWRAEAHGPRPLEGLGRTTMERLRLGVNIDHVATVRNARGGALPDPVRAARLAEEAGADGITAHLREDRRHISDADIEGLMEALSLPLNPRDGRHRGDAGHSPAPTAPTRSASCPSGARNAPPRAASTWPVTRTGWRTSSHPCARRAHACRSSWPPIRARSRPPPASAPPWWSCTPAPTATPHAEGRHADRDAELERLRGMAARAASLGLEVHAGHGLTYGDVGPVAAIPQVVELNIGHFLIGEAVFRGLEGAIVEMRRMMDEARVQGAGLSASGARSPAVPRCRHDTRADRERGLPPLGSAWGHRLREGAPWPTRDRAAATGRPRSPTAAGIFLGLGVGGFFDGIVLHQVLQWHHMLTSAGYPPDSVRNLRINTLFDGLFHAAAYAFVLIGLALLWRAARRSHLRWSGKLLGGTLLMGFGLFNLVEGVVDHQILGIHHVNETVPRAQWLLWDIGFLVWGAAMLLGGWALWRAGRRETARGIGGPRARAPVRTPDP